MAGFRGNYFSVYLLHYLYLVSYTELIMSKETSITNTIIRNLKKIPYSFVMKIHGSEMQSSGFPDILCAINGKMYAFETKTRAGKLSKQQEIMIKRLRAAGVVADRVESWYDVKGLIDEPCDR